MASEISPLGRIYTAFFSIGLFIAGDVCRMSVEMLLAMNASCGACASLGPPPSAILTLPPPPLPAFLKQAAADGGLPDAVDAPCDLQGLRDLEGLPQVSEIGSGSSSYPFPPSGPEVQKQRPPRFAVLRLERRSGRAGR